MQESQTTTTDTEIQALRDHLRDTAERLHKAELDNNQLRERMALRQRELEEARHQIASIRADGSDAEELKQRLMTAERRAGELAREAERLGAARLHEQAPDEASRLRSSERRGRRDRRRGRGRPVREVVVRGDRLATRKVR
jgi:cell division septum initiation protein DivIVA